LYGIISKPTFVIDARVIGNIIKYGKYKKKNILRIERFHLIFSASRYEGISHDMLFFQPKLAEKHVM